MTKYSRLASVEEKRNIKRAYFYMILSITAVLFLVFFGLPTLIKFAGFVGRIGKPDSPVDIADTTPPAPPQVENLPEYTNLKTIEIKGKTEEGAIIIIRANNRNEEVVSDANGDFRFEFKLNDGENLIDFMAKDSSNNESQKTETYKIIFDDQKPEITIESPSDGNSFYGQNQRQLAIKGKISEIVDLKINERVVSLKDDLSFIFSTTLSEGENKFEIKAKDMAGNENSTSLTVNFTL